MTSATARDWALLVAGHAAPDGRRHVVVPPAVDAYARFGGLRAGGCVIDPRRVLHSVATLAAFGAALGEPLSPLGEEGDGVGILAIDARGRVFTLDHTAEWYLGASVDEALETLRSGRPARVGADGTW